MNDTNEKVLLLAKKRQFKRMTAIMFVFMLAGPLLGPKIFSEDFSHLTSGARLIFYAGTAGVFGALFVLCLIRYRRIAKRTVTADPR